jgi:hypothetical protein
MQSHVHISIDLALALCSLILRISHLASRTSHLTFRVSHFGSRISHLAPRSPHYSTGLINVQVLGGMRLSSPSNWAMQPADLALFPFVGRLKELQPGLNNNELQYTIK